MRRFPLFFLTAFVLFAQSSGPLDLINHNRPIVDAHNCYPYEGKWSDRLDRALQGGYPVGIEQDLAWGVDKTTGKGRPVVSHQSKTTGSEPTLREYFFEHVRPFVEKAIRENNRAAWPLIVVHFDVKDNRPELLEAVWTLLGEYEPWLTTAKYNPDPHVLMPYDVKPLLVMTEEADVQEEVFFRRLKVGDNLRIFGSAHTAPLPVGGTREDRIRLAATTAPEKLLTEKPTNYRRWWNNSWYEVEEGGQPNAGEWTSADDGRLRSLVSHAHKLGYWIRFYTLDGFIQEQGLGWDRGYNFGSRDAVLKRWNAAIAAGVDLIATDQYEDLAAVLKNSKLQGTR